jgi:DNA-binding MarR family transcriptional regulator
MLPRLMPEFRHVEKGLLDGFSEHEVRELNALLRRLLKNARGLNR